MLGLSLHPLHPLHAHHLLCVSNTQTFSAWLATVLHTLARGNIGAIQSYMFTPKKTILEKKEKKKRSDLYLTCTWSPRSGCIRMPIILSLSTMLETEQQHITRSFSFTMLPWGSLGPQVARMCSIDLWHTELSEFVFLRLSLVHCSSKAEMLNHDLTAYFTPDMTFSIEKNTPCKVFSRAGL